MIKESIYTRYLSLLVRLLLGGVFITSSMAKLPMQSRFVDVVQSYRLLPDSIAAAYGFALPWIELLVGCYLVLGILVKPGAIITILMSISFFIANISSIVRGDSYCPNCFGELVPLTVVQAITIDVLVIIAAILLLVFSGKEPVFSFDSWYSKRYKTAKNLNK
jgi:uncharacterized membrane protein YphA (DoxX/SURF4 family)